MADLTSTQRATVQSRQRFRSQYGRPSISVSALCPTRALDWRLGRTHVGTPAVEVETMVRAQVRAQREPGNAGWTSRLEAEAVRYALWRHAENLAEYRWVMGPH